MVRNKASSMDLHQLQTYETPRQRIAGFLDFVMNKVQKPIQFECYTLTSEPFRF
jgi:hypothetical protein